MAPTTTYHLHTFYASSCAARIRIAFNLKNIPFTPHYIDMQTDDHESAAYRALNPSAAIPTLVVETLNEADYAPSRFSIAQSLAILEYLEEALPEKTPLLPPTSQPEDRARVRELMHIVASDIFPPTNSRIAQRVRDISGSRDIGMDFVRRVMKEGFTAYEALLERHFQGKKYSAGDEVTLADVCLVPQVEQARFYQLDFSPWPLLSGVVERLEGLDAFRRAGWRCQGDTPEQHRSKEDVLDHAA